MTTRDRDAAERRTRWARPMITRGVVALVTGVGVGYLAYRVAADLPGTELPDQGNRLDHHKK